MNQTIQVYMISVDEALEAILRHVNPLDSQITHITEALGRVLAEDIVSTIDIPPFANSAMDGYAVRSEDIASAAPEAPVVLEVIAEVAAGAVPDRPVQPRTAVRIMTGAPVPPGSDAVVPFELTSEGRGETEQIDDKVAIYKRVKVGDNVRKAGEDVRTLSPQERSCPDCGKPRLEMTDTEDSQQIEIEVRAYRRVIRRKRYFFTYGLSISLCM